MGLWGSYHNIPKAIFYLLNGTIFGALRPRLAGNSSGGPPTHWGNIRVILGLYCDNGNNIETTI